MKIKLITDSMASLKKDFVEKHNIDVVRLSTLLDDVSRIEGYEDTWEEFYQALENSKNFPMTSQPSPYDFEQAYQKAFLEGYDEVLVICVASQLSGTYTTAQLIANQINPEHIHVVDSHQLTLGQHMIVEYAVSLIEQNFPVDEIIAKIDAYKDTVSIDFVPVTMEYLKRGGRVNGVVATIASVLNIKPILNYKANTLTNIKKVFGMAKGIAEMIVRIPSTIKKAYVLYIYKSEYLKTFIQQLSAKRPDIEITTRAVNPVTGSHIGIGSIGIAY